MFHRNDKIVVGYDESDEGRDALALAELISQATGAALIIGYVSPQQPRWYGNERNYRRALRDDVASILSDAAELVPAAASVETASLAASSPSRGLHELAEDFGARLLVIGSTHRGPLGRVLLGSVGELLLTACPCAVAVAPRGFSSRSPSSLGVVGAGFDGSPESRQALTDAHALAEAAGSRLRAIAVEERSSRFARGAGRGSPDGDGDSSHGRLEQSLDEALAGLKGLGAGAERAVVPGQPHHVLADGGDLGMLVIGSRGYGPLRRVLLGSTSSKLMRSAACPLLIVPRAAGAAEEMRSRETAPAGK